MGKKLCRPAKKEKSDEIGRPARNARFIRTKCGRAAEQRENLCKPMEIAA